jgi:hypothetical protein
VSSSRSIFKHRAVHTVKVSKGLLNLLLHVLPHNGAGIAIMQLERQFTTFRDRAANEGKELWLPNGITILTLPDSRD